MNDSNISQYDVGQRIVGSAKLMTVERWGDCCSGEDHRNVALCNSSAAEQSSLAMVEVVDGSTKEEGSVDEPLLLLPLNQMNDSDFGQAELFFELGRVIGVSMEGRVDEVCQLVREFLMTATPYDKHNKLKPKKRNFSKGARGLKRL